MPAVAGGAGGVPPGARALPVVPPARGRAPGRPRSRPSTARPPARAG